MTIKEIIKSFEGKSKRQIIKSLKKIKAEQDLKWSTDTHN